MSTGESGRLADEADEGALVGHRLTLQDGHVTGWQPERGHALEPYTKAKVKPADSGRKTM